MYDDLGGEGVWRLTSNAIIIPWLFPLPLSPAMMPESCPVGFPLCLLGSSAPLYHRMSVTIKTSHLTMRKEELEEIRSRVINIWRGLDAEPRTLHGLTTLLAYGQGLWFLSNYRGTTPLAAEDEQALYQQLLDVDTIVGIAGFGASLASLVKRKSTVAREQLGIFR